jgi:hypothetical protein
MDDLDATARRIIDENRYLVLGTADPTGRPWVSPVYYAHAGYAEFLWVSSPDARHSQNLVGRPEVSIVVFDSRAPIGQGQGVYMAASASPVDEADLPRGMEMFSATSVSHGARPWTMRDVTAPEPYRLYRAVAGEHWVVDPEARPNRRTRVTP